MSKLDYIIAQAPATSKNLWCTWDNGIWLAPFLNSSRYRSLTHVHAQVRQISIRTSVKGTVHHARRYMKKLVSPLEQTGSCQKDGTHLKFVCGESLRRCPIPTSMTEIQKRKALWIGRTREANEYRNFLTGLLKISMTNDKDSVQAAVKILWDLVL